MDTREFIGFLNYQNQDVIYTLKNTPLSKIKMISDYNGNCGEEKALEILNLCEGDISRALFF